MTGAGLRCHLATVAAGTLFNVQFLRFAAAGAILTLHAADVFLPNTWGFRPEPWTAGVDVFFIISGFIMSWLTQKRFGEPGAPASFLVRRAIRVVPPYWLFTTLTIVAMLLVGDYSRETLAPAGFAAAYAFIPWPNEHGHLVPILAQGWTLNYEALFYLSFAAALAARRGLAWLTAGFLALVALHSAIPPSAFMLAFWSEPIILEFLAGIGLAQAYVRGIRLPFWASLVCAGLAVLVFVAASSIELGMFERVLRLGLPALLVCAGLMLAPEPRRPGRLHRLLLFGGDISYTLYLSHVLAVAAASFAWRRLGLDAPVLGMAVAMAAAILAAALLYRGVERPMTDFLRRRAGLAPSRGAADVAP